MLSDCQNLKRLSWSPGKIMVKDLRQRSGLAWFCACAESCVVFDTGPYTDLPDNSILITANMQLETGFPSSHQLKSYVASKSCLKLAACAVLSADAGLLVLTTDTVSLCLRSLISDITLFYPCQSFTDNFVYVHGSTQHTLEWTLL